MCINCIIHSSISVYIPRFLWLDYERSIVNYLRLDRKFDAQDDDKKERFVQFTIELFNDRKLVNNLKYYYHILLEIMNLAIVSAQLYSIGYFLNMNFNGWNYEFYFNPMIKSFPKISKCFFYYISYGSLGRKSFLCVLPYNYINEKIYLFLWFWLQLLIIFNLANFLYRFLLSISRKLRCRMISIKTEASLNREALSSIVNNSSIGEWFTLNILSKNLNFQLFDDIVNGIYRNSTRNSNNLKLIEINSVPLLN